MGVDIVTYRGRIGTFKHAFGQDVVTQDVLVNIPSVRRIIVWEMLGVLVIISALIETSFVLKSPHEFKNTIHGLQLDHWHVADSLMPLTLHFILEVIAHSILLTAVLPEVFSTHTGIFTSCGHDMIRDYRCNDPKINIIIHSLNGKSISAGVVSSASFIGMLLLMAGVEPNPGPNGADEFTHGLKWDNWHVEDFAMPLTLHFVMEAIGYNVLLTDVLPELYSASIGGHAISRNYICNGSVLSVVGSVRFIGMLLLMAGVESNPGPYGAGKNTCKSKFTEPVIHPLLQRLELVEYFPGKIKLFDVISISQDDIMSLEGRQEKELPWILLRKLIFVNENAFCLDDPVEKKVHASDPDFDESSSDEENRSDEYRASEEKLNYLDVFLLVYQCCCPMLQQILFQRMFLCKFAVPFLITSLNDDTPILSSWPLRSLVVETNSEENRMFEFNVLDLPTKCVAFCRIGRPKFSKSQLLNTFVSDESSKTFFNYSCQSGNVPKSVCIGYIETFWLLRAGNKMDKFDHATMVLNMRGCVKSFSKKTKTFVSKFADTISVFIQKGHLPECKVELENITLLFKTVIIVIVGSSKKKINDFLKDLSSYASNNQCIVSIVTMYDKTEKQMKCKETITEEIVKIIQKIHENNAKSFKTRWKECTDAEICTDEQSEACKYGKTKALEFRKMVNLDTEFLSLKEKVTPFQSTVARDLGKLLKEIRRENDIKVQEKKRKEISTLKEKIKTNITEPIKHVLKVFCDDISLDKVEFFLSWLGYYISQRRHNEASENVQKLTHDKHNLQEEKSELRKVESVMAKASFSVGHLFREIGLIYDNVCEEDAKELNIPSMEHIASVIGKLMATGCQLELIDGESFYLQRNWLSQIFMSLDKEIHSSKVMTVSVLGIQSSGKSTLLNTMFGTLFLTSAGRCTRGIHAQLIPLHADFVSKRQIEYQYILILDTEGLRPTDVTHENYEHDNELATLIAGLGNTTIVSVMGEHTNTIRDILQIVSHAFLRIKLANKHIILHNRCFLVQQNITALTAKDNMKEGLNKFVKSLDEMTKDSARCEGIKDIYSFNQVINFDFSSDVWYFKNVWHGDPPFGRVNWNYSETASEMKLHLVKQVSGVKNLPYTPLHSFIDRTNDLWQGVLNENFVFSFKNSIERRAYLKMDECIQEMLWKIEYFLTKKMYSITQKELSNCHTLEKIKDCETSIHKGINTIITDKTTEAEQVVNKYFDESEHSHIIFQWKENQRGRIVRFFDKIKDICDVTIRNEKEKKRMNFRFQSSQMKNAEALKKKMLDCANAKPVKNISDREIAEDFEKLWAESFGRLNPSNTAYESELKQFFDSVLFDIHTAQAHIVREILGQVNWYGNTNSSKSLVFENTGIEDDDISKLKHLKVKLFDDVQKKDDVKERIQSLYKDITNKIDTLCQDNDQISELHIRELLHFIHECYTPKQSEKIKVTFKKKLFVKIDVYVSIVANNIFEEHNKTYRQQLRENYESCKRQQMLLFQSYFELRKSEDTLADMITEIIHRHIDSESVVQLSHQIQLVLHGKLPANKNGLIINICDALVDANDFKQNVSYIMDPFRTAQDWFEKKANSILFDENSRLLYKCSLRIVDVFLLNITNSLMSLKGNGDAMITTKDLVSRLLLNLRDNQISIPETDFGSVKNFHPTTNISLTAVCDAVDGKLKASIDQLKESFSSYTKDTVRWKENCPVRYMFKSIWGCCELCPYCNEPCENSTESHTEDHTCGQHRPQCCSGWKFRHSEQACAHTCNYSIYANFKHACHVFKYKCSDGKTKCNNEKHQYRKYRTVLKDWFIQPWSDMQESSTFWLWLVGRFKQELAVLFGFKVDEIPASWSNISSNDAKESLRTTYRF